MGRLLSTRELRADHPSRTPRGQRDYVLAVRVGHLPRHHGCFPPPPGVPGRSSAVATMGSPRDGGLTRGLAARAGRSVRSRDRLHSLRPETLRHPGAVLPQRGQQPRADRLHRGPHRGLGSHRHPIPPIEGGRAQEAEAVRLRRGVLGCGSGTPNVRVGPDTPAWALMVLAVAFAFIPVTTGIGILRHSLYDIDLVVSRALVYGALAAFITAVYVGVVVGIGAIIGVGAFAGSGGNVVLSLVATAVIALAFQPLRERARRLANRLVYGKRATPYEVLSGFSDRVAGSYATEDLLPEMTRILGEGTRASRAEAWLRVGEELRRAAAWPGRGGSPLDRVPIFADDLPDLPDVGRVVPVRHQGELLG